MLKTLSGAAVLFGLAWTVHTADHARRGVDATSDAVVWSGTAVAMLAAVTITLVVVRHPLAPALSAVVFLAVAIGVSASHLLPDWGVLSDPILVDSASDNWSVVAVGLEIVAAAWLGIVATTILRRNNFALHVDPDRWEPTSATVAKDARLYP